MHGEKNQENFYTVRYANEKTIIPEHSTTEEERTRTKDIDSKTNITKSNTNNNPAPLS